jgi:hypothetical protein
LAIRRLSLDRLRTQHGPSYAVRARCERTASASVLEGFARCNGARLGKS